MTTPTFEHVTVIPFNGPRLTTCYSVVVRNIGGKTGPGSDEAIAFPGTDKKQALSVAQQEARKRGLEFVAN